MTPSWQLDPLQDGWKLHSSFPALSDPRVAPICSSHPAIESSKDGFVAAGTQGGLEAKPLAEFTSRCHTWGEMSSSVGPSCLERGVLVPGFASMFGRPGNRSSTFQGWVQLDRGSSRMRAMAKASRGRRRVEGSEDNDRQWESIGGKRSLRRGIQARQTE